MDITQVVDQDTLAVLAYVTIGINAVVQVLKELLPQISARLLLVCTSLVCTIGYLYQIGDWKLTTGAIVFAALTSFPAGTYSFLKPKDETIE